MPSILTEAPPSHTAPPTDELLDIYEASEIRDAQGARRFGSVHTIRRRVKDGSLPHTRIGSKYYVRRSALEPLATRKGEADTPSALMAELEVAVNRVLASSGPLSDEQCARIAARLKGVAA
jgi:hypothetical protein